MLTAEPTPEVATGDWSVTVEGLVQQRRRWTWDEVRALPNETFTTDIHCVTTWTKLGCTFTGVSVDVLLDEARPLATATHVFVTSASGYTTNLALADLVGGQAWLVWVYEGSPLAVDHGGPVRLLVPHLYFWKSAKWVTGLQLLDHDQRGFWEENGYHDRGDPWLEQRYHGD